jgi:hypothetical protein
MKKIISAIFVLSFTACLEPPEEMIDQSRIFGDPNLMPADAPHVQDDPDFTANVAAFSTSVAYLRGYAEGDPIWYWNVDGPNATFIAPMFQLVGPDGPIGRPIIDVIPGDTGYTPWWRTVTVRTTAKYAGEKIWSREAIDAGVRLGILEPPEPQREVKNCPVILRDATVPVDVDQTAEPTWGWYRNRRVHWIDFTDRLDVPTDVHEMPLFPVYVMQRIDQSAPIYEFVTGVDVTGDGDLDDTNNIFGSKPGGPRYSPLWYVVFVRTVADYPSIDTGAPVGLSAEDQFVDQGGAIISPLVVPDGLIEMPGFLVNCGIQRAKGSL